MFLLIKIHFINITQIDPQTLLKLTHKCYSNRPTNVTRNKPTNVTRNKLTNVTQIDPQVLLKLTHKCYSNRPTSVTQIDPQTLLKINFVSGAKLKNLIAKTARLKPLNKTKQNYTKKTLVNLKRILLSI